MYRLIPTPIVLILVLTVLTCIVSYWADNLGKKLGKKRISLLGLRPRQTATLLTMLSSLGIMLGTLLVLTVFVNQVRDAIVLSDSLKDRNVELLAENKSLEETLKASQERVRESRRLAQQAQKDEAAAVGKTRAANRRANAARQRAREAEGNLRSAQARLAAAEAARSTAQRGEAAAVRNAATAQGRLTAARSGLRAAQSRLDDVRSRLNRANSDLRQTQTSLKIKQSQLRTAQAQAKNAARGAFNAGQASVKLKGEVTALEIQMEQQQEQVNALEKQRQDLEIQVASQQANLERIRLAAEQVVGGRFVIARDQVFAERVVAAGLGRQQIEAQLRALIEDANRAAKAPPARANSLRLAPLWVDFPDRRVQLNEQEILDSLANFIAGLDTPVAVRMAAARNYTESESDLQGVMVAVPVRVAFARDTTIATATIEGKQSEARIFNQLLALANEGESVARGRGVTPPLTPDAPNFFAAGTNERIFEALRRIQDHDGPVGVRLVAADDLSTVEPMRVRFEVGATS